MQDDCGTVNIDTTRRRKKTRKNKKSVGKVINCHQVCHANLSEAVFMFYESLWYTELEVVCMWPDKSSKGKLKVSYCPLLRVGNRVTGVSRSLC